MNCRFLVTGGQGFVGRYLVSHLLSHGDVVVLSLGRSPALQTTFTHSISIGRNRVLAPLPSNLKPEHFGRRYQYASIDLCRAGAGTELMRQFRPEVVIHLASGLRDDPAEHLFGSNIVGTQKLIETIARSNIPVSMFLLASSGGVYGVPTEIPITENVTCLPVDIYSTSKLCAEHVCRIACKRYHIPFVTARIFNVVGPGQDERHVCGRLAAQVAAIVAHLAEPTIEVGDLSPTRDFIDVRDVAKALHLLAQLACPGETYNVGSGRETSIAAVLDLLLELSGLANNRRIKQLASRESDIPRHVADISRIERLGFTADYSLRQSVCDLLRYYSEAIPA